MMPNESLIVWEHDQEAAEEAVINRENYECRDSKHGAVDFIMTFLENTGLWDTMTNRRPSSLRQDNGYDYEKLNGIAALKEIAGVRRISASGKVLKDAGLMARLGFALEIGEDKKAAHEDTLRNHLNRFTKEESYKWFIDDHVHFLRQNKWIREKIYAVDGYEIEVTGKTYEGIGKVWNADKKEYRYGYKLLLLVNTAEGRERIVGAVLGEIQEDERKLCLKLFELIEEHLCPIKELIGIILMDRGYWGAEFLHKIYFDYKIDIVSLAKKNSCFVKDEVNYIVENNKLPFVKYKVRNKSYYERKTQRKQKKKSKEPKHKEIYLAYEEGLGFGVWEEKDLNVVIMKTKNKEGKWDITTFVTTLPIKNNPLKIYELYSQRWTIENDINRELDQRWNLRTLPGRNLNIIVSRIMLVLKLFNAEKILEMKYEGRYKKIKKRMREQEEHNFFEEPQVVVFIPEKNIFGAWRRLEYYDVIYKQGHKQGYKQGQQEKKEIIQKIKARAPDLYEKIQKILENGQNV